MTSASGTADTMRIRAGSSPSPLIFNMALIAEMSVTSIDMSIERPGWLCAFLHDDSTTTERTPARIVISLNVFIDIDLVNVCL